MASESTSNYAQNATATEPELVVMPTGRAGPIPSPVLNEAQTPTPSVESPDSLVKNFVTSIDADDETEPDVPDRNTSKWVVLIVVLLLLVFALAGGIIYYLTQFSGEQEQGPLLSPLADTPIATPTPMVTDEQTLELEQVSSDDEVTSIQTDVDSTDLKSLDKELDEIDTILSE